MALSRKEFTKIRRLISIAQDLIAASPKPGRRADNQRKDTKRVRRTGKELAQFRRMLKGQRKSGVSVADLARKHRISTAYIYTL